MAVDNDGPVAEITLERYRLKELRADVAARLERRMQADDQLRQPRRRARPVGRTDSDERSPGARRRARSTSSRGREAARVPNAGHGRSVARWALPAAVAAGVALMALLPWTIFVPAGGDERIKGSRVADAVPAGRGRAAKRSPTAPSRVRATSYASVTTPPGAPYGVIVSIDGRGHVTMHLPPAAIAPSALGREPTVLLDQAYELDDAPRWERFYFITGDEPFPIAPIVASGERAVATAGDGDAVPRSPSPQGFSSRSFRFRKRARHDPPRRPVSRPAGCWRSLRMPSRPPTPTPALHADRRRELRRRPIGRCSVRGVRRRALRARDGRSRRRQPRAQQDRPQAAEAARSARRRSTC